MHFSRYCFSSVNFYCALALLCKNCLCPSICGILTISKVFKNGLVMDLSISNGSMDKDSDNSGSPMPSTSQESASDLGNVDSNGK